MNREQRRAAGKQTKPMLTEADRLLVAGQLVEAGALFRRILAAEPSNAIAIFGLGQVAARQERLAEAETQFRKALALSPNNAGIHVRLGQVLTVQNRLDGAQAAFERATTLEPRNADAVHGLGFVAAQRGRLEEAIAAYRRAVAIKPDVAVFHINLGNVLRDHGRHAEAAEVYRRAIALQPGEATLHSFLGVSLMLQGRPEAALPEFARALTLDPSFAAARSNRLLCLGYVERPAAEVFDEHRRWGVAYGRPAPSPASFPNVREAGRRLRVGYVSGDFARHAVASFLAPAFEARDRSAVEVFAYAEVALPDAETERFRRSADHWSSSVGVGDDALAERIRADRIDILVDLAGHTARSRLQVFTRKPAPIQVSWLGYPDTTGLPAIDYRLVDAITDPPGEADAFASERLVRLEDGFHCFSPPLAAPQVAPPPCLEAGHVTFGSFNAFTKLSEAALDAWAAILTRLPDARLVFGGGPASDEAAAQDRIVQRLAACGVGGERLSFLGWTNEPAAHLARYSEVDIALDSFPYNGTTTTCEALWMGAPVVAVRGARHASRVSASLLSQIGRADLIAEDVGEYTEIAVRLASDRAGLAAARAEQRARMAASPLCDAPGFARKLEAAYRAMWTDWLAKA